MSTSPLVDPAELERLLEELEQVPAPFAVGGPHELWTDPYVQRQLLAAHLDPDVAGASREHAVIARSVAWMASRFDVAAGRRVLDLGCGPGLYANPLAEHGAWGHGIDLSAAAIAEARRRATTARVRFEVGDYLEDALAEHDLALLIYGDLCAMAPASRHRLLERVAARMHRDGRLLLDVFAPSHLEGFSPGCVVEEQLMDGFWAAGRYLGIHQTVRYDPEPVLLERYVVVQPDRVRRVHCWLAHLTPAEVERELAQAGFVVLEVLGDLTGAPYDPDAEMFALVAALS